MKYILTEKQLRLLEREEPGLSKIEIIIFKKLNEVKKKLKTRKELHNYLTNLLKYFSISEDMSRYFLQLYVSNYRKDGRYELITKDDLVDPRKGFGLTTSNTESYKFSRALLPFRGSNLEGFWTTDGNNTEIYVVRSYGWYPIYIYRDGIWYQNVDRYSSSTGRQISNVNPVEWDENLLEKVHMLTKDEMQMLLRGKPHEEILKHKIEKLKKKESELQQKRVSIVKPYGWYDEHRTPISIKFKINSIDTQNDKAVVNVDIHDVMKRQGSKSIETPENYLKGEIPNIDKAYVENSVKNRLLSDLHKFITPRKRYGEELKDVHNLRFNFNHLKSI